MSHEIITQVKRTIWVAECPHDKRIAESNPPRECYCNECQAWIPFKEVSYTGPSLK